MEFETVARFTVSSEKEIRITSWNDHTPFRVAVFYKEDYLNGAYCTTLPKALGHFNHLIDTAILDYPTNKKIELDLNKDESLREYLIEQILENNEPDQILIDLLKVDLLDIAEQELNKTTTQQLKDIV